jgi:hypothetical protein
MTRQPEMEIPASTLPATLDDIRRDGGYITNLTCTIRNGHYKVKIMWPEPAQMNFGLNPRPMQ